MILIIAINTKMGLFGQTIKFGLVWRNFYTIIAQRMFRLLLLVGVDRKINQVDGIYLKIFEYNILMQEYLGALFLAIQINGIEPLRQSDGLISVFPLRITIRFSDSNFA